MNISFIIPVSEFTEDTKNLVNFLLKNSKPSDEIIVVKDGSPLYFSVPSYNFRIINLNRIYGPAKARNIGAENSLNEILVFLDSDVKPVENFIEKLRKIKEKEIWQGVYFFEKFSNIYTLSRNIFKEYSYAKVKKPESLNSYFFVIRKKDFFEIGKFDESFKEPGSEDTEFGFRAKDMGYKIVIKEDLKVIHKKKYSFFSLIKEDFRKAVSKVYLFFKERRISISLRSEKESLNFVLSTFFSAISFFSPVFLIFFIILNLDFFRFIKKKLGISTAFQIYLIYFFESFIRFLGIVYGGLKFLKV